MIIYGYANFRIIGSKDWEIIVLINQHTMMELDTQASIRYVNDNHIIMYISQTV